jgi:hypothetical protein
MEVLVLHIVVHHNRAIVFFFKMHVVAHNEKFASIGDAKTDPNGLAVFAYYFQVLFLFPYLLESSSLSLFWSLYTQVVSDDNPGLASLLSIVEKVKKKG